jgi:hypothetical protein
LFPATSAKYLSGADQQHSISLVWPPGLRRTMSCYIGGARDVLTVDYTSAARPSLSRARSPGAPLRRILSPQDQQSDRCRRHARAEVDAAARARRKPGPNVSGRTTTGLLSARARAGHPTVRSLPARCRVRPLFERHVHERSRPRSKGVPPSTLRLKIEGYTMHRRIAGGAFCR